MFDHEEIDAESMRFACKVAEVISDNFPDTIPFKDLTLGCLCSYAVMCKACGIDQAACKVLADKMLEKAFETMDRANIQMFKGTNDA